jgi:valine--pyruvate aminotransferase
LNGNTNVSEKEGLALASGADPNDPASYASFIGKQYAPDLCNERALKFIREDKDKPFFLYYPTTVPHLALQVPEDSLAEYNGKLDDKPYAGGSGYLPHQYPRAAYAAMITRMDRDIGKLVQLVKDLGREDNTIFIFTSDNGAVFPLSGTDPAYFQSNGKLRGYKQDIYEGGLREPLIVSWKGHIPAGTTSSLVTGFEDWFPTLLDLVGESKAAPENLDGISFAPTLLGGKQPERPFLYCEFHGVGGQQAVRVGDWKLVRQHLLGTPKKPAAPTTELFNLGSDPAETTDVAAAHPDIVARLEKLMAEQHVGIWRPPDWGLLAAGFPSKLLRFMSQPTSSFEFSLAGRKLAARSGILALMDDMGQALTLDPHMRMLGGGNPAVVPGLQSLVRERMAELLADTGGFDRMMVRYDPPQGNPRFLRALADLLRREFGWDIGPQNLAITSGGQSAFFYLFNLLAGKFDGGRQKKILLPLAPEYIGYADQGIEPDLFVACRPSIEWPQGRDGKVFKYCIDFAAVESALARGDIGAIAASRPTNPSGNVLMDAEVAHLSALAAERGIPLILDNAYGTPFPSVMFVPAKPFWAPHVILALSLSKLGLPGTRTGIVIAPEPVAKAVSSLTAIVGLANGTIGQQIVLPWIESGKILELGPKILRPFYEEKGRAAAGWAREYFDAAGVDWALHANEGSFFHWLWLKNLRITTRELYERLKARKVLTVPGEYFFFGLAEDWPHRHECLRLNFSRDADEVREGYQIIAEEAARASG